jgi:hypothetical protein
MLASLGCPHFRVMEVIGLDAHDLSAIRWHSFVKHGVVEEHSFFALPWPSAKIVGFVSARQIREHFFQFTSRGHLTISQLVNKAVYCLDIPVEEVLVRPGFLRQQMSQHF